MMASKMDVYSIGEMVIDFMPGSGERTFVACPGGAPANLAIAVTKNGFSTGLCTSVGNDDFGRLLVSVLKDNKVAVINDSLCDEAITTMTFVSLDNTGNRSFTFARKPGADMFLHPDHVKNEDIEASIIVHAGSCSLSAMPQAEATKKALRLGREFNKIVSFDVNYRNVMWNDDEKACTDAIRDILPYVDLLKVSDEEIGLLGGEEVLCDIMQEFDISVIVETLGKDGAIAFFKDERIRIPGLDIKAVNTTAAGDAFWGGFLSYLLSNGITATDNITSSILSGAVSYGNAAGGLACSREGAIESLPDSSEILEICKREGYKI